MNVIQKMQSVGISRWLSWLLIGLGVLLVVLLIFDAGFAVGTRRAMDGRMHGGPGTPLNVGFGEFGVAMPHGFIPDGHGAVGTITALTPSTITLETRDGNTEEIVIDAMTQIQGPTSTLSQINLYVGQNIVALGNPHQATSSQQLKAVLIRILPPTPIDH